MASNDTIDSIIADIQSLYKTEVKEEDIEALITITKSVILDDFITSDKVTVHVITREYPEMNEEEKSRLEKDITMNNKIFSPFLAIIEEGKLKIFDGRNRYELLKKISNDWYEEKETGEIYSNLKDIEILIYIYVIGDKQTKFYKQLDIK